jgi:hypothetical protein
MDCSQTHAFNKSRSPLGHHKQMEVEFISPNEKKLH